MKNKTMETRLFGRTLLAAVCALALLTGRVDAQQIFWTETGGFNQNLGSVWTAAFDGSGKTAIATNVTRPFGIGLDAARGYVYWAQDANGGQDSLIVRANLDGSNRTNLFSTTA
ncbi:MAG: hypothetical protein M3Y82_05790, partial [Verrucomicrobiota bacterium]|nr:hypothetical protein [Verrucomicrobiota bacterium]